MTLDVWIRGVSNLDGVAFDPTRGHVSPPRILGIHGFGTLEIDLFGTPFWTTFLGVLKGCASMVWDPWN